MLVQCQTALCTVHAMQANQEILKLQASAAEEAERSAAAVQAQQSLQDEVQAQQQVQKLLHFSTQALVIILAAVSYDQLHAQCHGSNIVCNLLASHNMMRLLCGRHRQLKHRPSTRLKRLLL